MYIFGVAIEYDLSQEYDSRIDNLIRGSGCRLGSPLKLLVTSCYEVYGSIFLIIFIWLVLSFITIYLYRKYRKS